MNYAGDILVLVFIPTFEQTVSARLSGTAEDGYWLFMNKLAGKEYERFRYGKNEEDGKVIISKLVQEG